MPQRVRWVAACLICGVLVGGALSVASWVLSGGASARSPETFELVIPEGTAARIEAGDGAPALPADLTFVVGDTLVLRNEDSVAHAMGPYPVLARTTLRLPLERPSTRSLSCTFHPRGAVDLIVKARADPTLLVWSALVFGLPLGGGAAIVLWVVRDLA